MTSSWRRALGTVSELTLIAGFVTWFYLPFLTPGVPGVDFASDVMVGEVNRKLLPSPLSLPHWSPDLMCGRPVIDFVSPFRLLELPLAGLEPIQRLKSLLILYHVLAGFSMYALLRGLRTVRGTALFGGLVYPIMTAHVSRTAITGHVTVVMSYAMVPLVMLAFFRLTGRSLRWTLYLGLALALAFVRDTQRTLLLVVVAGLTLSVEIGMIAVRAWWRRDPRTARRGFRLAALALLALVLGVALDAYELLNDFHSSDERMGWRPGEQDHWLHQWSVSNLYSYYDRDGAIANRLTGVGDSISVSNNRYLGVSLLGLTATAAAFLPLKRRRLRQFWFAIGMLGFAIWLSFGLTAPLADIRERWQQVLGAEEVPAGLKAGLVALALLPIGLGAMAIGRHLPGGRRRRLAIGGALSAGLALLLVGVPLLPVLRQVCFVLRDFRNPDWFNISITSWGIAFAASLAVEALASRLRSAAARYALCVLLAALAAADFHPYRRYLDHAQRSEQALQDLRAAAVDIARDPADIRVAPVEAYSNLADLTYIWHRKRLAWDFRSYSAPTRTGRYFDLAFALIAEQRTRDLGASMLGLAQVKYLIDVRRNGIDLGEHSSALSLHFASSRVRTYEVRQVRPFVQSYPRTHVLVGPAGPLAALLAAELARDGHGFLHVDTKEEARAIPSRGRMFADAEANPAARADPEVEAIDPHRILAVRVPPVANPAEIDWSRPSPERIVVQSRAERPSLLVVAESWHPWWKARVDGEPVRVYPGNYAFLGVPLAPGSHRLELTVEPPWSVHAWGYLSLATLASVLAALGWLGRRRRPARPIAVPARVTVKQSRLRRAG